MNSSTNEFITYDYLSLEVLPNLEQLYVDCYQCFGWILTKVSDKIFNQDYYINSDVLINPLVTLNFKRNHKISNKSKLLSLQKDMEDSFKKINKLTKKPDIIGTIYSISSGVIGLIFILFAILIFTFKKQLIFLSILNLILGSIFTILAYFIYNKKRKQIAKKNEKLIEIEYNKIYTYCEKANNLVS